MPLNEVNEFTDSSYYNTFEPQSIEDRILYELGEKAVMQLGDVRRREGITYDTLPNLQIWTRILEGKRREKYSDVMHSLMAQKHYVLIGGIFTRTYVSEIKNKNEISARDLKESGADHIKKVIEADTGLPLFLD